MYLSSSFRSGLGIIVTFACLLASCNFSNPRKMIGKRSGQDTSNVSVSFDPTALGELAAAMKTLQISVFKVENDVTAGQEGAAWRFDIEAQKTEYTIKNVQLGLKDIEVAILDAQNLALGTGKVRVLVKPGKNTTEPLKIKLNQIVQPVVAVPVEIKVAGEAAAQIKKATLEWKTETGTQVETIELAAAPVGATTVNYEADIKPILEENCVSCHKEGNAKRKLKLDRWPFVSGNIEDAAELLATVMDRVQNEDEPMPQAGLMDAALIKKMTDWQAAGFLASAPASGELLYRGSIADRKVAEVISATLILTGIDGIELFRKQLDNFQVQESGILSHSLTLSIEDSSVAIPIIVER